LVTLLDFVVVLFTCCISFDGPLYRWNHRDNRSYQPSPTRGLLQNTLEYEQRNKNEVNIPSSGGELESKLFLEY
jgi:hypothetical protein